MRRSQRERVFALSLLAPCLVTIAALMVYPYLTLLYMSLYKAGQFTLSTYQDMLADPSFLSALKVSLIFTIVSVAGTTLIGFGLALLFEEQRRGKGLFRTILLIPLMIPAVVSASAWTILYHPTFGLANYLLSLLGIAPINFLGSAGTALWSVLLVNIWINFPFPFLVFSAALAALPKDPFESARIDGASSWQTLRYITLPALTPIMLLVIIFRTVWSFQAFDELFVMTGGGPGTSTMNLYVLAFRTFFFYYKIGAASAILVFMLIVAALISGAYIIILRRSLLR
jgi:multiple sugar transport system permease protein